MDMKHEAEIKVELVEDIEDNTSNVYSEQLSTLEEIQERNSFEFIDVKSEIEVKKEPFDIEDEVEKEPSDIEDEVKKENSDTEEEETTKDELSDKICGSDENQV
ncbi:hypothetical protein Anas_14423 [Armadillidium nasatum]|uniref:Uncharacterized protein n=1 Tax=Armadillidium nasatum TaxID=96803 RepID=A0A5N5SWS3_9CRUS|nr:hypothetical protein Anas_14423 [Armadillidium nasatum]